MNTILEDVRRVDLPDWGHRGIAFTMLFSEVELPLSERMGHSLEALLRATPSLSSVLQSTKVSGGAWSETLSAANAKDQKVKQWSRLEQAGFEPFNPTDREGKAAPKCVIVARARHLVDDTLRMRFSGELAKAAVNYSQFVVIFVADAGEAPFDTEESAFQARLLDFARLFPKPVALHLVSEELDDGQPISKEDLADGIAIAILADLCTSERGASGILGDIDESLAVALYAIGTKGVVYEPEVAAAAFKTSLTGELAQQVLSGPVNSGDASPMQILSPRELFAGLSLSEQGVTIRIFEGNDPTQRSGLCGRNYAVRFDFEGANADSILKNVPPHNWPESLRRRREFLLESTVPAAALRISAALAELLTSQFRDFIDRLADAFASDGLLRAQDLCDEFGNRISDIYWTDDLPETSDLGDSVERNLTELERAVQRIPSISQLVAKAFIRLLLLVGLVLLTSLMPLPFQTLWFWICGIAAGAGVCHLGWTYWRTVQAARKTATHVAELIHEEMRAGLNALAREHLARERRSGQEQVTTIKDRVSRTIEPMVGLRLERASSAGPNCTGVIKRVPWRFDQVKLLNAFLHMPDSLHHLHNETMRFVSDAAPRILDGTMPPNAIAVGLQHLSDEFCRKRLSSLSLSDFFHKECRDSRAHNSASVDEEGRRLHERPDVFLQSVLLNDCRSQPNRMRRAIVTPERMATQWIDETSSVSLAENVMAIIVRAELARLSYMHDVTNAVPATGHGGCSGFSQRSPAAPLGRI